MKTIDDGKKPTVPKCIAVRPSQNIQFSILYILNNLNIVTKAGADEIGSRSGAKSSKKVRVQVFAIVQANFEDSLQETYLCSNKALKSEMSIVNEQGLTKALCAIQGCVLDGYTTWSLYLVTVNRKEYR